MKENLMTSITQVYSIFFIDSQTPRTRGFSEMSDNSDSRQVMQLESLKTELLRLDLSTARPSSDAVVGDCDVLLGEVAHLPENEKACSNGSLRK